ncbi:MAG: tryptophan-rich sensory protein [Alphaproteobacteria bacterium]|nr:tryptophan-rich sensory protein [Alphaproteobacteria bacterium]MDE1986069.1 tryptophan-rich sensory protein [Alphaproteobacteria bacterium]MDE2264399.1 tryptophan-rich sensory protein [Alphaproteobacteria bacterium]MDE2499365.1 tryptophan-rich sensory protein [Alphaproteobacteria bacterium]
MSRKAFELLILFALLAGTLAVGFVASQVTVPNIPGWYAGLHKPGFNPPNWLFAPVWTSLYVLMAVAAWRVWRKAGLRPLALYALQLALNGAWSFIFFGAHTIGFALIEIVLLLAAVLATLGDFWGKDRLAGLFFVPYAGWVLFAGVLNAAIWRLNG